jgi:hypothetical protein
MSQKNTKVRQWLEAQELDLFDCKFKYLVEEKEVSLSYNQVEKACIDRLGEVRLISIFNEFEDYFKNRWYDRDKKDYKDGLIQEISSFMRDMANYKVFEKHRFFTWKQLAKNFSMDEKFLKWWMKEKDLTEQQMLCDHDDSDQFAEDGRWYNSVGTCIRCKVRMENTLDQNDEVSLVYKAWKRK